MGLRQTAAIIAGKTSVKLLRLMGRGGTAIPGKIALKICPDLLGFLAQNVQTVVVTGTNGKTTSSRIVEEMLALAGMKYFANRSGANLINGITAEFFTNSSITGKPKCDYAVIESDEAASKLVCKYIQPKTIFVTNIFRDQLDRYGEVMHTLNNVLVGIKNAPKATVCLNADCSLSVSLAEKIPNNIIFFGVNLPIYDSPIDELSDATHCIKCKTEYEYRYRTFGHLGGFNCPNCGYKRPTPQVAVTEISDMGLDTTTVEMDIFGDAETVTINLPGGYNIYNAAGALAVSEAMGLKREPSKKAVASFNCGFGRMELFDTGKSTARMILIKNPAGANQVLNYLTELSLDTVFVCCLNDHTGDGTDISWIYDVNFEKLVDMGDNLRKVYVSGIRHADMAVRLKYAGLPLEKLIVTDDYDKLIDLMRESEVPVIVMPTYSAMMDLRDKMSAAFGGKDFWE